MNERPTELSARVVHTINRISAERAEAVRLSITLNARLAKFDGLRDLRRRVFECACCHYNVRPIPYSVQPTELTGGWACTTCEATEMPCNVGLPKLCRECARAYDLCASCMGDMEMRQRSEVRAKAVVGQTEDATRYGCLAVEREP